MFNPPYLTDQLIRTGRSSSTIAQPVFERSEQAKKRGSTHVGRLASPASQSPTHQTLRSQPVFERSEQAEKRGSTHVGRLASPASQSPTHQTLRAQPVFERSEQEGKRGSYDV